MEHGYIRRWDLSYGFWNEMELEAMCSGVRLDTYQAYCDMRAMLQGCSFE